MKKAGELVGIDMLFLDDQVSVSYNVFVLVVLPS